MIKLVIFTTFKEIDFTAYYCFFGIVTKNFRKKNPGMLRK